MDADFSRPDGAYADASWHHGQAALGVVRVANGVPVESHRRVIRLPSNNAAEAAAILWAFEMYPAVPVYSDCQFVARFLGAKWIPRERNTLAHRAAAGSNSVVSGTTQDIPPKMSRALRRSRRFGAGGGCMKHNTP